MDPVQSHPYSSLTEGTTHEREYTITPEIYEDYLRAFGDRSPLHIDDAHAKAAGFAGPVMHGGILNGFLSHFVGMVFPGATSLLLSSDLRYQNPSYLNDRLKLTVMLTQKMDVHQVIVLHITFLNLSRKTIAATGRIQVKVREA